MPTVSAHDDRTSSAKPQIAVIGTSLVRGLGPRLTKRGFEVSCFVYAGCEIPMLCDRIKDILSAKYQPDVVILQCAGNDLENGWPPSQVIQQMDYLIHEIKGHCPRAYIMLNHIPPRGENSELLDKISMVNTFIHNISRDKRSRVLSCDVCPTMFRPKGTGFTSTALVNSCMLVLWPKLCQIFYRWNSTNKGNNLHVW